MHSLNKKILCSHHPAWERDHYSIIEQSFQTTDPQCWAPAVVVPVWARLLGAFELAFSDLAAFSSYLVCTTNHSVFCMSSDWGKAGQYSARRAPPSGTAPVNHSVTFLHSFSSSVCIPRKHVVNFCTLCKWNELRILWFALLSGMFLKLYNYSFLLLHNPVVWLHYLTLDGHKGCFLFSFIYLFLIYCVQCC